MIRQGYMNYIPLPAPGRGMLGEKNKKEEGRK